MTDEEAGFLAAIAAASEDALPRLVYADFLEEQGDAGRAEYSRLMVRALAGDRKATDRVLAMRAGLDPVWVRALGVVPTTMAPLWDMIGDMVGELPPAADKWDIARAERQLGAKFPPSYREFLLRHDGFELAGDVPATIFGVATEIDQRVEDEDGWGLFAPPGSPVVALGSMMFAPSDFRLLCGLTDQAGESPVVGVSSFAPVGVDVLGSNFAAFLWFLLENYDRCRRGGVSLRWLNDSRWRELRDPGIAQWNQLIRSHGSDEERAREDDFEPDDS